jgi:phage terminase large subunit GpA-like protein
MSQRNSDPQLTPYMNDFIAAFEREAHIAKYGRQHDAIVMVCGAQMGKTEAVIDVIGQAHDRRAAVAYVAPSRDFAVHEFQPRLRARLRDITGDDVRWHSYAGCVFDELDRHPLAKQGEIDHWARSKCDPMRAAISTPVGSGRVGVVQVGGYQFWQRMPDETIQSRAWQMFQSGTMHHWAWPCPHCGRYFVPRRGLLGWAHDADDQPIAWVRCPCCLDLIYDNSKEQMNALGLFVAPGQVINHDRVVEGRLLETSTLSFWVSGLCSPFVTFGSRVSAVLQAAENGDLTVAEITTNTAFGELYGYEAAP